MPKQTRWAIKQGMERAANCLSNAQDHLVVEGNRFETEHPDIYEKFKCLVQAIEVIKNATLDLRQTI